MTIEQRHNLNQKKQQAERRGDRKTPDNAKSCYKKQIALKEAEIFGLRTELELQKGKTKNWQQEYENLISEIFAFEYEIAEREARQTKQKKELVKSISNLQAENSILQEIIDDLKFQLADAEKEIADLEEQNFDLRKQIEELEENADSYPTNFYVEIGMREKDFC